MISSVSTELGIEYATNDWATDSFFTVLGTLPGCKGCSSFPRWSPTAWATNMQLGQMRRKRCYLSLISEFQSSHTMRNNTNITHMTETQTQLGQIWWKNTFCECLV